MNLFLKQLNNLKKRLSKATITMLQNQEIHTVRDLVAYTENGIENIKFMKPNEEKKQNPTPKFKLWDKVTISGTLTGFGDLTGEIRGLEYSLQHNEFFYTVTTEVKSFWSSERFLVMAEMN